MCPSKKKKIPDRQTDIFSSVCLSVKKNKKKIPDRQTDIFSSVCLSVKKKQKKIPDRQTDIFSSVCLSVKKNSGQTDGHFFVRLSVRQKRSLQKSTEVLPSIYPCFRCVRFSMNVKLTREAFYCSSVLVSVSRLQWLWQLQRFRQLLFWQRPVWWARERREGRKR